jgi:CysZ protein
MPIGRALSLALQQLSDPAFRRTLLLGIGLSLLVFGGLAALTVVGIHYVPATRWHWLDDLVAVGGAVGFLIAMWLLFPAVVSLFIGLLLDDVAEAVERRYYAHDPPGRAPSLLQATLSSLKLMIVLVVLNILVLPLYVVALFVPFLSLGIFLVLNGYLLGREYFELVAIRHLTPRDAGALRRYWRGRVFLAGIVIAGLFAVPVVNLLAPIIGAAFMMHVFKGLLTKPSAVK